MIPNLIFGKICLGCEALNKATHELFYYANSYYWWVLVGMLQIFYNGALEHLQRAQFGSHLPMGGLKLSIKRPKIYAVRSIFRICSTKKTANMQNLLWPYLCVCMRWKGEELKTWNESWHGIENANILDNHADRESKKGWGVQPR